MNWYRYRFSVKRVVAGVLVALVPCLSFGDTVETRDGARLVGKITGITDETIIMETVYAGSLEIKKAEVIGFSTDEPVFVRLKSGKTISGKVTHRGESRMEIGDSEGFLGTEMADIALSWVSGAKDPAVLKIREELAANRRMLTFEIGFDMS